jgi:cytochrome P450
MIRARKAERAAGAPPRTDLLARLLAATDEEGDGQGLTEVEVRDQLVTLFLAGHETTSQALTWTWYLLAQHPDVEAALHAELSRELGGRAPNYDDLPRLVFTEQVLEEAMRLYPPVYMVARRAERDTVVGDVAVPAGTELALWIYWAHRDPRWFPLPDAFKPERFAPENKAGMPSGAYVPFGAGPRACIGKVFAMIEAKIILATLAQRFRARLAPGQKVEALPRITLTPRYGMRMRLQSV